MKSLQMLGKMLGQLTLSGSPFLLRPNTSYLALPNHWRNGVGSINSEQESPTLHHPPILSHG